MTAPEFRLGPDQPGYLYIKVADHLEARIRSGDLRPGARLPGERDLALDYGVSIGTVRRATDVLRERGAVVTLPAKGTYVVGSSHGQLSQRQPLLGATHRKAADPEAVVKNDDDCA